MKKQISAALAAAVSISAVNIIMPVSARATSASENYKTLTEHRQLEELTRGLVAVQTDSGVYLSWRLLATESTIGNISSAPSFDVYKNGVKITTVTDSTNYIDKSGTVSDKYQVAVEGSGEACAEVTPWTNSYLSIPLTNKPADYGTAGDTSSTYPYIAGDVSCGDLDGDGEYELVVKWDANPQDNSISGVTGNVYLGAYDMDGTNMWLIDLGRNIRSGEHYTQFLVYDFDGDGKAEITCKTAPGSKDGIGSYVTAASADAAIQNADNTAEYANDGGYILEGPEYFTVFNGQNGAAIDTINYPTARVSAASFGDAYGNRCDRYIADIAYLDGETPYAVYWRGYYGGQSGYSGRTGVFGAKLQDGRLHVDYIFDTLSGQPGYTAGNESVIGNGNHNITIADVDGDNKDEVISGAVCFEVNESNALVPKWNTKLGHGDALHIGDYDPTNDGFEYFTVHEGAPYGMSLINAEDGTIIDHYDGSSDTGRGVMANVGAGGYFQYWASRGGQHAAYGNNTFADIAVFGQSMNFRIFWDGDLYDELLDGTVITSYNGNSMETIFTADGCKAVNGTKNVPNLTADLFGDWREEVVYATTDSSELRIYTTTVPTSYKLPTLMHDPVYRSGVAAQMSAYNQPPHIGFYLADEIFKPSVTMLKIETEPYRKSYNIGDTFDSTGLTVRAYYTDGTDELVSGYVLTGFDSSVAGTQIISVNYGEQTANFNITVETGFVFDGSRVTGVSNTTAKELTIPVSYDGADITIIADGALKESSLNRVIILGDIEDIGEDVFPEGITVVSYEGSVVQRYCAEHSINFEIIDTADYTINLTFDEAEYNDFSLMQAAAAQSETIEHITYSVGGRNNGARDGHTGFYTASLNDNSCLYAGYGRFGDRNRNGVMAIVDTPMLSNDVDYIFAMDFVCDDIDDRKGKLTLNDTAGTVDIISSTALNLNAGDWYTYKLVNHKGTYTRFIYDSDDILVSKTELGAASSEYGITSIAVASESGSFTNNEHYCGFYIDNFKIYNNAEHTTLNITITDDEGNPIMSPVVKINGIEYTGNVDGVVTAEVTAGAVTVTASADGYVEKTVSFSAHSSELEKTIILSAVAQEVIGIEFDRDSVLLKTGGAVSVPAKLVPENTDGTITYLSSDNTVASVDENGYITALSEGGAVITASCGEFSDTLTVTVYGEYDSVLTSIELTGPDSAYIPQAGYAYSDKFIAALYDQKGVEIAGDVTWNITTDSKCEIENGVVKIPSTASVGSLVITASCQDVSAATELALLQLKVENSSVIAEPSFDGDLWLTIGNDGQTKTVGNILYGIGGRNGGDGTTYIGFDKYNGRNSIVMQAGRFSGSGRNPYMSFVNAPSAYSSGIYYVWECELIMGGSTPATLTFYDASLNKIYETTAAELGINENESYFFSLAYKDGIYTQYITDSNGDIISATQPSVNYKTPIARVDVTATGAGASAQGMVRFVNLCYYSAVNYSTDIAVMVIDENGEAAEGVTVGTGVISGVTNSKGRVTLSLPVGVYQIKAFNQEEYVGSVQVISDGASKIYILAEESVDNKITVDGNTVIITVSAEDAVIFAAAYDNDGVIQSIESIKAESGVYTLKAAPDKVFMWHKDMTPITVWSK